MGEAARIGCMSRVNGEMKVDRGRLIWKLLARTCLEHASEMWWAGRRQHAGLVKNSRNIGRKLVPEVAVRGNPDRRKLEERREDKKLLFGWRLQ